MTRLVGLFRTEGVAGLISKKRAKQSNLKYSTGYRDYILGLIRQNDEDFGPTLALEKLAKDHDVNVSNETLRTWMIDAGIWVTRKERRLRVYQPRNRRDCFRELIQIDGSHHR